MSSFFEPVEDEQKVIAFVFPATKSDLIIKKLGLSFSKPEKRELSEVGNFTKFSKAILSATTQIEGRELVFTTFPEIERRETSVFLKIDVENTSVEEFQAIQGYILGLGYSDFEKSSTFFSGVEEIFTNDKVFPKGRTPALFVV